MINPTLSLYFFQDNVPQQIMEDIARNVASKLLFKMSVQKNPEIAVSYSTRILEICDNLITIEICIIKDEDSICNNSEDSIEHAFIHAFYSLNPTNYEVLFRGF
jgi:hypothetical protein